MNISSVNVFSFLRTNSQMSRNKEIVCRHKDIMIDIAFIFVFDGFGINNDEWKQFSECITKCMQIIIIIINHWPSSSVVNEKNTQIIVIS